MKAEEMCSSQLMSYRVRSRSFSGWGFGMGARYTILAPRWIGYHNLIALLYIVGLARFCQIVCSFIDPRFLLSGLNTFWPFSFYKILKAGGAAVGVSIGKRKKTACCTHCLSYNSDWNWLCFGLFSL